MPEVGSGHDHEPEMVPVVWRGELGDKPVVFPVIGVRYHPIRVRQREDVGQVLSHPLGVEQHGGEIGFQHIVREIEIVLGRTRHRLDASINVVPVHFQNRIGPTHGMIQGLVAGHEPVSIGIAQHGGFMAFDFRFPTLRHVCDPFGGRSLRSRSDDLADGHRFPRLQHGAIQISESRKRGPGSGRCHPDGIRTQAQPPVFRRRISAQMADRAAFRRHPSHIRDKQLGMGGFRIEIRVHDGMTLLQQGRRGR